MRVVIDTPAWARIEEPGDRLAELEKACAYTDKRAAYAVKRFVSSDHNRRSLAEADYVARLTELKAKVKCSVLRQDEAGLAVPAGYAGRIRSALGVTVEDRVRRPDTRPYPWHHRSTKVLRPYQTDAVARLLAVRHGAVALPPGCHRRNERVLMYDGTLCSVQDVQLGDLLMGPDSQPRRVLALRRGFDSMYQIETVNGQRLFVNGDHVLVLRRTQRRLRFPCGRGNPVTLLTVREYLRKGSDFKHGYKLFSPPAGVNFAVQPVTIDPYFLGVLLGDGGMINGISVTTADPEIEKEVRKQAGLWGVALRVSRKLNANCQTFHLSHPAGRLGANRLLNELKILDLWGKPCAFKTVPGQYLRNARQVRLEVLAGLLDTDGHLRAGFFDFISKSKQLSEDVAFLARSLGLRATIRSCLKFCQTGGGGEYWRVGISGNTDEIPTRLPRKRAALRRQKKNVASFGFTISKVSDLEDFFGFSLDEDHLYLTDTFLVTHNSGKTLVALQLVKELGLSAVVCSPSRGIVMQTHRELLEALGPRRVGLYGDGKHDVMRPVTVATTQSLLRVKGAAEAFFRAKQVFIGDESHGLAADAMRQIALDLFGLAPYRFFLSGTQERHDGLQRLLEAVIGPVVLEMTTRQAVDLGVLTPLRTRVLRVRHGRPVSTSDPGRATQEGLYRSKPVNELVGSMVNRMVALGRPTLVLVDELDQFGRLMQFIKHPARFAHGCVDKKTLKAKVPPEHWVSDTMQLVDGFNAGEFPILVGTSTIGTGVDVRATGAAFYLRGGAAETDQRQYAGRAMRLHPGKVDCWNFDVDVTDVDLLHRHAEARQEVWQEIYPDVLPVGV